MNIDYEFACQDDCLDKMVPSDLRKLICERDQAYRNIDAVKAERNALAAQVEALRRAYEASRFTEFGDKILENAFATTTQQHLAEIRAEAGRAGFVAGAKSFSHAGGDIHLIDVDSVAGRYANSIRQEVK